MEAGCVLAAIVTVSGAVSLGYANSFAAERFRRFHDGSAIAAGLAGELGSYAPAWPILKRMLETTSAAATAGQVEITPFRKFERPKDLIFDEVARKLGL